MTVPKTINQAILNCVAQMKHPTPGWKGQCLRFCRTMYGIPMKHTSAINAWIGASFRHTTGVPPRGSFVFWKIGEFGHIAISDGNGYCISTDINGAGTVARVLITKIRTRWGATYLGWTEDVNGVRLTEFTPVKPGDVKPVPPPFVVSLKAAQYHAKHGTGKYLGDTSNQIAAIKRRLVMMGCGKPEFSFRSCYLLWQKHLGYKGTQADGIPGKITLRELARRSNWKVVA
jgi:hypothetical protein